MNEEFFQCTTPHESLQGGVLEVRRRSKLLENAVHWKKGHSESGNYLALLAPSIPSSNCPMYQTFLSLAVWPALTNGLPS